MPESKTDLRRRLRGARAERGEGDRAAAGAALARHAADRTGATIAAFVGVLGEPAGPPLGRDAIGAADLVLVPALAVDEAGRRLGQGGGSYDRALPRTTAPVVAVVFGDEVLDTIPAERHDRPVDGVLTPEHGLRWLRESPGGGRR